MDKITRLALLKEGLDQLDDAGLERVISYQGPFLLDGQISADGLY